MDDISGTHQGTGQGFSVRGKFSKAAMGSDLEVDNIMANILMQRDRAIVRVEKARVGRSLADLVRQNPNDDFWVLNKPGRIRSLEDGKVVSRVDPRFKDRDNVITVRRFGRGHNSAGTVFEETIWFNPRNERAKQMALALKNLDMDEVNGLAAAFQPVTRFVASMNTQWNPFFGLGNVQRDIQEGLVNLSSTPLAGKQIEVAKIAPAAIRGIWKDLRARGKGQGVQNNQWSLLWEKFQDLGGQTGYRDLWRTSEDRAKSIQKEIKRAQGGSVASYVRALGMLVSDYNEALENGVRLAAFKVALDNGMSEQKAAVLAKDLTINFNRKGRNTGQAQAFYAFFNARVQGVTRTLQTLSGPRGKMILAGALAFGAAQAVGMWLAGIDPEKMREFEKDRNTIIPNPWGVGDWFKIPAPLGTAPFVALGRLLAEPALHQKIDKHEQTLKILGVLATSFSPIGGANVSWQTFFPTALAPGVAVAENKDFAGNTIARDDISGTDRTPGHVRGQSTATAPSYWLSYAANALSGGTEHKAGKWSWNPVYLDYLVGQFFGGPVRQVQRGTQAAYRGATGGEVSPAEVPIAGMFYGSSNSPSSTRSTYFGNVQWTNGEGKQLKGMQRAGENTAAYTADNPGSDGARYFQREVAQISKMQRDLRAERARMSWNADMAPVRQREAAILARMRAFNARVDAARKPPQ